MEEKPRIAYVLLWFPLASETFIFREISDLARQGIDIQVYTMYGRNLKGCTEAMRAYKGFVYRMGVKKIFAIAIAFFQELYARPKLVWRLMRNALFRKMRNLESQAENTWCFMAGFLLAKQCRINNVRLIHSAWANGPATAAWIASELSSNPFAFTGRAGDIYPEDGILREKMAAAKFIRVNNEANAEWLKKFCVPGQENKIRLIYNGLTFENKNINHGATIEKPYKILAVGRFARTKGFTYLLTAMRRLRRENFPCELTLVGNGWWKRRLLKLRKNLELENCVHMPGFIPNDELDKLMRASHLLVVPSVIHKNGDRDGIPNVIMEACTVGLPVVATDVCGISEVIKNNETGYLVEERNAAMLAREMRKALENYSESRAMALHARDLVRQMFDSVKNSQALKQLYINAIASKK